MNRQVTFGDIIELLESSVCSVILHGTDGETLEGTQDAGLWHYLAGLPVASIEPDGDTLEVWVDDAE